MIHGWAARQGTGATPCPVLRLVGAHQAAWVPAGVGDPIAARSEGRSDDGK